MTYELLQDYWWFLVSLLAALTVMLMFVQGAQTMLLHPISRQHKELLIGSVASRWELTFTTLVTFGGAFFASFPLFYSTSFSGAYWVWVLILLGFILQAVSYKYRQSEGNIFGTRIYDAFLAFNGITAPLLLGAAVGTFYFGSPFTIDLSAIASGELPSAGVAISSWGPWHGLEALADWRVVAFGLLVLVLTRSLALMWFVNQIDAAEIQAWARRQLLLHTPVLLILLVACLAALLCADGLQASALHDFVVVKGKYLTNFIEMPLAATGLLLGAAFILTGIIATITRKTYRKGIWLAASGTVLVVLALLAVAGYNNTAFYPSCTDISSSLTIRNASSSPYTLTAMSWVSLFIPFVLAYIAWVWRKLCK